MERRLLLEPLPWLFWSGGSFSEPLWIPLEQGLLLEPPWLFWSPWSGDSFWSPFSGSSGAEALLQSPSGSLWSGDSFWSPPGSSGALGAETPFGAPLALLERRLPLEPFCPFFSPSGSPGAKAPLWSPPSSLKKQRFFLEPFRLPMGRRLQRSPSSSLRSGDSY